MNAESYLVLYADIKLYNGINLTENLNIKECLNMIRFVFIFQQTSEKFKDNLKGGPIYWSKVNIANICFFSGPNVLLCKQFIDTY